MKKLFLVGMLLLVAAAGLLYMRRHHFHLREGGSTVSESSIGAISLPWEQDPPEREIAAGSAYVPKYQVGTGEYNCFILDNITHQVYSVISGIPSRVGGPSYVKAVTGGAHHWLLIDSAGDVWSWGDNATGECGLGVTGAEIEEPVRIKTDSLGHAFSDVVQVIGGGTRSGWGSSALKKDGTVWVWGNTMFGLRGNGQQGQNNTRPVQVNFPAGTFITKIQIYAVGLALDSSGNVWTWGGSGEYTSPWNVGQGNPNPDYMSPHKIALPGKAKDIAGGSYWNYALLRNGSLYGWGYYTSYLGIGNGGFLGWNGSNSNGKMFPQLLDTALRLPHHIRSIYVNNNATYAILTDSSLWGWGDASCGALGNGMELDYSKTKIPYNWDWGFGELMVQKPVPIGEGLHSFTNLYTGDALIFYCYAEDVNGQLYSWGRNKASVLGNGVMDPQPAYGHIRANFPNSWDVPWITPVNPFALKKTMVVTSPHCVLHPDTASCAEYKVPEGLRPVAVASSQPVAGDATKVLLDGSASHDDAGEIMYYEWKQVSGPSKALITLHSMARPMVARLKAGTYIFRLKVTDNGWKRDSTTVTVTVPAAR